MNNNNKFNIIIAVNIIVYAITIFANQNYEAIGGQNVAAYDLLSVYGPAVLYNHEWYRVLTYSFAHASILHLAMNMIALYSLAEPVIRFTNEKFALITYFASAIISGLAIVFFSNSATVGASGAIFGLFGVLIYYAWKLHKQGYRDLMSSLGPVIVLNLAITLLGSNISVVGHLSGLIAGLVAAYIYDKKFRNNYYR